MKSIQKSIIELLKILISIPSQAGINNQMNILNVIDNWFSSHGMHGKILFKGKKPVAFLYDIIIDNELPTYCFNACIDTAHIGDTNSWENHPFLASEKDNWLFGRGAADSKVAVSIFANIAKSLISNENLLRSNISFLFDCDEHTGSFGGIKTYLKTHKNLKGVFIGYPGNNGIVSGSRGFYRAVISFFGVSEHSGRKSDNNENAIIKVSNFIQDIYAIPIKQFVNSSFPVPPKITITKIRGGYNFTVTPDKCIVDVDIRLTPLFTFNDARQLINESIKKIDNLYSKKTVLTEKESWPAYYLDNNSYILNLIKNIASKQFGKQLPSIICGPSNIGNYLSIHGIDAVCGFGVTYENLHAANEGIDLDSINDIYYVYYELAKTLC